jgi:hypothetical protein
MKENWLSEFYLSGKAVCGVCANRKGVGVLVMVNKTAIMMLCPLCQQHKRRQHGWESMEISAEEYRNILDKNKNGKNPAFT